MLYGIHYNTNMKSIKDKEDAVYLWGTIDIRFTSIVEAFKTARELTRRHNSNIKYRVFKEAKLDEKLVSPDNIVDTMDEYFAKKQADVNELL